MKLLVGEVTFMHLFLNIPVKPKLRSNKPVITCKEQRTTGLYVLVRAERGSAFLFCGLAWSHYGFRARIRDGRGTVMKHLAR